MVLTGLLVAVLGGFAWLKPRETHPVMVIGTLSAKDLARIENTVRHEILWRGIFPDFYIKTIKELPGDFKLRFARRAVLVRVGEAHAGSLGPPLANGDRVRVEVHSAKEPFYFWFYDLKKTPAGWLVGKRGQGYLTIN